MKRKKKKKKKKSTKRCQKIPEEMSEARNVQWCEKKCDCCKCVSLTNGRLIVCMVCVYILFESFGSHSPHKSVSWKIVPHFLVKISWKWTCALSNEKIHTHYLLTKLASFKHIKQLIAPSVSHQQMWIALISFGYCALKFTIKVKKFGKKKIVFSLS